jgi:hypothetical protein
MLEIGDPHVVVGGIAAAPLGEDRKGERAFEVAGEPHPARALRHLAARLVEAGGGNLDAILREFDVGPCSAVGDTAGGEAGEADVLQVVFELIRIHWGIRV